MSKGTPEPPSVFKRAFYNQYNLIMLGGAAVFAVATWSWLPLALGAGLETLWMVLGADSKAFRRWAALQDAKEKRAAEDQALSRAHERLDYRTGERFVALRTLAEDIRSLAHENQSLSVSLMTEEMSKIDELLQSFVRLALNRDLLRKQLDTASLGELQREVEQLEGRLKKEKAAPVKASLQQSLSLAKKRLTQQEKIAASHEAVGLQMDNIERSLHYLKSCIVSATSREELSGTLDELMAGVDAVEETVVETGLTVDDMPRRRAAARAAQKAQR